MRVVRLIFKNLEAVFSRLSPVFSILKKIYHSYKIVRIFIWAFLILYILPYSFRWFMHNIVYTAPFEKIFDVSNRQVLYVKDDGGMYLKNFYMCDDVKYVTYENSTKETLSKGVCSEEFLINKNIGHDGGIPPKNFSTAILPENKIVYSDRNSTSSMDIYLSVVKKVEQKNEYMIETNKIFSKNKFDIKNYHDRLIKKLPVPSYTEIYKLTGSIWEKPFLIEADSIVFYDAMVTKHDSEKPIEAVSRKWKVSLAGDVVMEEGEREGLNMEMYNYYFVENNLRYSDRRIGFNYFAKSQKGVYKENNFYYPYGGNFWTTNYESPSLKIDWSHKTFYGLNRECLSGMLGIIPCDGWYQIMLSVKSDKFKKEYMFKNGTVRVFHMPNPTKPSPWHGTTQLLGVNQEEDVAIIHSGMTFLLDLKNGGLIHIQKPFLRILYLK